VIIINSDHKTKDSKIDQNPSSVPKAKVFQEVAKHGFNDMQLAQNLKNYYDCNLDGMSYNEDFKEGSKKDLKGGSNHQ
jgi:hypothetical protein